VFELIGRAPRLRREFFESDPDEKSTANMVALNACLATLAAFQARNLFTFAIHLLDRKPKATHLLGGLGGILSRVVGHDVVRAVGRHLNAEQLHLVVFGKASDLDSFAMRSPISVDAARDVNKPAVDTNYRNIPE
jgi:hypothetical protein